MTGPIASGSFPAEAVAFTIVKTLKEYGPVSADLLARLLHRRRPEIQPSLEELQARHVIRLDTENKVSLLP
jgi:hypothetical protein